MVKVEARSKWACKEPDCDRTYESPIEGTISVNHPGASYDRTNHVMEVTWRSKYDKVAAEERKLRVKGVTFYV